MLSAVQNTAASLVSVSPAELRDRADQLRERLFQGESPAEENLLVSSFALMNEAVRRTLGFTYYEVQYLAGLALARGHIAEMQTGEGKTLVAGLPAFLYSLAGKGVHVVTTNSYLAHRDCSLLAPAFELLGVQARVLPERVEAGQKQLAYQADITYGTGAEFGFDYLRDQVALRRQARQPLGQSVLNQLQGLDEAGRFLQRSLYFAVVDEIDSLLIDDANSPLLLSEAAPQQAEDSRAHWCARESGLRLEQGRDYCVSAANGTIQFTETGLQSIFARQDQIPFHILKRPWMEYVRQAIRAEKLFHRDVHYVVTDEKRIQLVDESTGRLFEDRHWRDGLHQAVEAKEHLPVTSEKLPLAQVTRQHFFRLYQHLCGMTGTATGSEAEFSRFYGLSVVPIPLRMPCRRSVSPPRYFADAPAKWQAVALSVGERQRAGQPVLVGTRTIFDSEVLSGILRAAGVEHQLLNGCQDQAEADIIARAGEPGRVTIATNMAGRGTDIKLRGESTRAGGLHVIGTARHHSSRLDRQLIGRCARQGDPGSAQFFLSAEDQLVALHEPRLAQMMQRSADARGEVHLPLTPLIDRLQQRIELAHYQQRRELFKFNRSRETMLSQIHGFT